jgi:hypothetical protein
MIDVNLVIGISILGILLSSVLTIVGVVFVIDCHEHMRKDYWNNIYMTPTALVLLICISGIVWAVHGPTDNDVIVISEEKCEIKTFYASDGKSFYQQSIGKDSVNIQSTSGIYLDHPEKYYLWVRTYVVQKNGLYRPGGPWVSRQIIEKEVTPVVAVTPTVASVIEEYPEDPITPLEEVVEK